MINYLICFLTSIRKKLIAKQKFCPHKFFNSEHAHSGVVNENKFTLKQNKQTTTTKIYIRSRLGVL